MGWIDNRIAEYYQWLKDNTAIREDKGTGWFSVSTPFVGLFNDNIEIFVKKESDTKILLSDDGETIEYLFLSGVDVLRSQKHKDYMQKVANNFGIKITSEGEIVTESNGADFARKMNNLCLLYRQYRICQGFQMINNRGAVHSIAPFFVSEVCAHIAF